jgi:hypothetical protein
MPGQRDFWVVYRAGADGKMDGQSAVCTQSEWEEMERRRPGHHALVRAGIATEAEAEKLARAGLLAAEAAEEERRPTRRSPALPQPRGQELVRPPRGDDLDAAGPVAAEM